MKGNRAGIGTIDFVFCGNAIDFWTARFLKWNFSDWHLYARIHTWGILTKTRKQQTSQGVDASTVGVAPGRIGRDEHGKARRANTALNGGTHVELERLRLNTCSKSDFSNAETTWPTYLHIHLQGGLRCGGLATALAPRIPAITEHDMHYS